MLHQPQQQQQQQRERARRRCEGTAMGAIALDLRPGLGIGPFTLGIFILSPLFIVNFYYSQFDCEL